MWERTARLSTRTQTRTKTARVFSSQVEIHLLHNKQTKLSHSGWILKQSKFRGMGSTIQSLATGVGLELYQNLRMGTMVIKEPIYLNMGKIYSTNSQRDSISKGEKVTVGHLSRLMKQAQLEKKPQWESAIKTTSSLSTKVHFPDP